MKKINSSIFIKRLSKRAKLDLPQTRLLFKVMHDQITQDLSEGKKVRLKGIGILHRVNHSNDREYDDIGRKTIYVYPEKFHVCFSASRRLKRLMQAAYGTTTETVGQATPRKLRKHEIVRQQAAEKVPIKIVQPPKRTQATPVLSPVSEEKSDNIPIEISKYQTVPASPVQSPADIASKDENIPIKIKVKPKLPTIAWRTSPDKQYLPLSPNYHHPSHRMLLTLLRQLGLKWQAITVTPQEISVNDGLLTQPLPVSRAGIAMVLDAFKDLGFDIDRRHYHTKIKLGTQPTKTIDLISGYAYNNIPFIRITCPIIETGKTIVTRRSPLSQLIVDAAKDNRRIAVLGPKQSRNNNLTSIIKILSDMNMNYHRVGSNEEYDINIGQHLKKLPKHNFYHPITVIENLSGADDWYYLQQIPSGIIALLPFTDKADIDRIIELQQLPLDIFHSVVRSILVPTSCPDCQPIMDSAVKYPALRRIAGQRNELLHVHPIRVNQLCDHPKKYLQLYEEYTDNQLIGASIIDQLYDLLLKHEIDWPVFANYYSD